MTSEPEDPGAAERAAERARQAAEEQRVLEELAAEEEQHGSEPLSIPPDVSFTASPKLDVDPQTGTDWPDGAEPTSLTIPPDVMFADSPRLEVGPETGTASPLEGQTGAGPGPLSIPPAVNFDASPKLEVGPETSAETGSEAPSDSSGVLEPAIVDSSGQHVSALSFMDPDPNFVPEEPSGGAGGSGQRPVSAGSIVLAGYNPAGQTGAVRPLIYGLEKGNGDQTPVNQ